MAEPTHTSRDFNALPPVPQPGGIAARARAAAAPYLADLNPEQRAAVETLDGPVLVLAGAGTGKTRVLTTRIAHILATGRARPSEILSVTFTNKAAREMKQRVGAMVGQIVEGMPWLGTFHSIGVKILRRHAELVGLKPDFTILDTDDQIRLMRQILEAEDIDEKRWPARMLAGLIDSWKNRGLAPDQVVVAFFGFLYPLKGFHDFIRAAALLKADGVDAKYLIVGGAVRGRAFFETTFGWILLRLGLATDYDADAHELVQRLGLGDDVQFVPFTLATETLYRASDIVVSPSRGPELGRPVLEGAACGCPVVASGSLGGAGIVLPEQTGMLVPRRSPDALAAALGHLARDPAVRSTLGGHGRRHAELEFDADVSTRRVVSIYDRILGPA